jgi:hypothetical protein
MPKDLCWQCTREFCTCGARVMITRRTMDHLGPVANGSRQAGGMIEAMVCDVRQHEQVEAVVNRTVGGGWTRARMVKPSGVCMHLRPYVANHIGHSAAQALDRMERGSVQHVSDASSLVLWRDVFCVLGMRSEG